MGTGFWSRYQLAGWHELAGVECVAVYNRTRERAAALAAEFKIPAIYDNARELFAREPLDFVDIITDVSTHAEFVALAAAHKIPVICQKPLARSLAEGTGMVQACRASGVPFYVHENWRWQTPLRELKRELNSAVVGTPFRARVNFCSSFPVFDNQPFLKNAEQFILADVGSHILDTIRFLFGEVSTLFCQTHRIHSEIKGEDVATLMLSMKSGMTVLCEMSYASRTEHERFPETYVTVEATHGSIELGPDYWLRVTTAEGTLARRYPPPRYAWADPAYDLVHASIVPCHANLLGGLRGEDKVETTGEDNLRTAQLVFAAYESAQSGAVIRVDEEYFKN